jgi:hypothetical protein
MDARRSPGGTVVARYRQLLATQLSRLLEHLESVRGVHTVAREAG